jgi:NAD-dependent SIR2 family protein deacetylase
MFKYTCIDCKQVYTTQEAEPENCVPLCMRCYAKEEMRWSLSIGKYSH